MKNINNKSLLSGLMVLTVVGTTVFSAGCASKTDQGTVVRESADQMKSHEQADATRLTANGLPPQAQAAANAQRELGKRAALTTQKQFGGGGAPQTR